jgi:hypothetical protein
MHYNKIIASGGSEYKDFNFSIKNDLNLYWIECGLNFKLYAQISIGQTIFQQSYTNHVWVLSNTENTQCFTFKLGITNKFEETNKVINLVSDMVGDNCNQSDVPK